jgi:hypothetical protein
MKRIQKVFSAIAIFSSCLFFTNTNSALATDIPMTIDGVINCAHPDNAITTTCRGEAPPPPVNTPALPTSTPSPTSSTEVTAPQIPMTIDGVINCANPDNAITTTCWDLAQAAKKAGDSANSSQVDCNLEIYKRYPVCTGIAPQSVIDLEKSKANATPLPEFVNCADPMLVQTMACTNRTTTDLPADCTLEINKNMPRCQPMTLADGSINCAQPDNAITTTCWEQAAVMKSMGATTAIDCKLPGYSAYPACTGVKPKAVIDFEKTASVNKPIADAAPIVETATAQNVAEEVKISGSVDLKSRSTKTTVLQIDLDLAKAKVRIVATKKGSKTLTQNVSADANGNKTVTFKQNLKGYTVRIIVDGETIDSLKL